MFFDLVKKNSRRNRKENGLYFSSLIVTIIAFYIILSLQNQDVILFLKKMESDALDKLFLLIPVIYGFSLFILFFLVYFAGKYQLGRRSHELGMYLMLGMRRSKLLAMMIAEEIYNSIISLAIGIPVAVFLSEVISLITAKLVGIGIIGHHFSFSAVAVMWTIMGFLTIRLFALVILCSQFPKKQIDTLLMETQEKKHRKTKPVWIMIQLIVGVLLLAFAYSNAIKGIAWENLIFMGTTVLIGTVGVFLFFHGIGILFQIILNKHINWNGLGIFTFRQLQESVFQRPNTLAVSSLLIMMALCCFAYGISVGCIFNTAEKHVLDYTFQGNGEQIKSELQRVNLNRTIDQVFEMKIGNFPSNEADSFSAKNLIDAVKQCEDTTTRDMLLNNFQTFEHMYFISLSSYNQLLQLSGKAEIELDHNQVALYNDPELANQDATDLLTEVLGKKASVQINNETYEFIQGVYQDSIVTDRSITIFYGLIVPDELYAALIPEAADNSFWNATLKKNYVEKEGLLQAITEVNTILDSTKLDYESYLQNMGRSLFYTVAASYVTIYLAIIFLIISNTVMGAQFLMHQQKAKKRYQTLIRLGADYESLCKSARKQITWYFSIPIFVASISAVFGTRSLFTGVVTTSMRNEVSSLMWVSMAMILFACVIEFGYMISVKRMSDRNMRKVMEIKREND